MPKFALVRLYLRTSMSLHVSVHMCAHPENYIRVIELCRKIPDGLLGKKSGLNCLVQGTVLMGLSPKGENKLRINKLHALEN